MLSCVMQNGLPSSFLEKNLAALGKVLNLRLAFWSPGLAVCRTATSLNEALFGGMAGFAAGGAGGESSASLKGRKE